MIPLPQVSPTKILYTPLLSPYALRAPPICLLRYGLESPWRRGYLSIVSVVCCQVEVSVTGWSLVQRSPTEGGASEYDGEFFITKRRCSTRGCRNKRKVLIFNEILLHHYRTHQGYISTGSEAVWLGGLVLKLRKSLLINIHQVRVVTPIRHWQQVAPTGWPHV